MILPGWVMKDYPEEVAQKLKLEEWIGAYHVEKGIPNQGGSIAKA